MWGSFVVDGGSGGMRSISVLVLVDFWFFSVLVVCW